MLGLDELCDVYNTDGQGGQTTRVKANLRCRMTHVMVAGNSRERAELAAIRRLMFDPSYIMPEYAQVRVAGRLGRWNVRSGTLATLRGPMNNDEYSICDVVRAPNG